jgi:small neutral amino acid transporter SnatA (MarC family)
MVVFILAGLYSLAGSIFNWEWFFSSRRGSVLARLIGRTGARIFYGLLGLLLVGVGAAGVLGLIE